MLKSFLDFFPDIWSRCPSIIRLLLFGFSGFLLALFMSGVLSYKYCTSIPDQCIGILYLQFPNNVFASLLGSMTGAILSFFAFSELEKTKIKRSLKPKIKAYFIPDLDEEDKEERDNYIDFNKNHKVYIDNSPISIGEAFWVRIKVKNIGEISAKQCRAYLTKISKYEPSGNSFPNQQYIGGTTDLEDSGKLELSKLKKINRFSNSMPLRWAYERRLEDYFILGSGINFPSNSSYFADVFSIYNPILNTRLVDNESMADESIPWFLKLSTKPEALNYADLLPIKKSDTILYKFDIEIYADECDKSSLSIILEHYSGEDKVRFLCLDKDGLIQEDKYRNRVFYERKLPGHTNIDIPVKLGTFSSREEDIYNDL